MTSIGTPQWSTLERQIAAVVERRAVTSRRPPVVLWQRLGEDDRVFAERLATVRARLPETVGVIAACRPFVGARPESVVFAEFPPLLFDLLHPNAPATEGGRPRNRVAYGGRSSAKSWSIATALVLLALERKVRVACVRETMQSLGESVHKLLSDTIERLGLQPWFVIQTNAIFGPSGGEFLYFGVRTDPAKFKSTEGVDVLWFEEAEKSSELSWQVIVPTIRKPGSEIWVSFNPNLATDPVYQRFVLTQPPRTLSAFVNFNDNPFNPPEMHEAAADMARVDPDAYSWIWLGQPRQHSDAIVFKGKWSIETFVADAAWSGPYIGVDFGFAQDPSTMVRAWIHERTLFVDYEAWGIGVDIDRTPALFDAVPDARRHTSYADSARPETISYLKNHGFPNMRGVLKWSGSVEDGIAHLRQYERIVVHTRCTHLAEELCLYSYRVDRLSGNVLPDVVDRHNHCIDALRYALSPLVKSHGGFGLLEYYRQRAEALKAKRAGGAG